MLALCLILAITLCGGSALSHAATISGTKDKVKELEQQKKILEKELKELESERNDILAYVEKLDSKLSNLEEKLDKTKKNIKKTEKKLDQTREDLEEAKKEEADQYENMKKRIQVMYENGGTDYADILLSSSTFSDLLNRSEYIEKISEYDNQLFDEFVATRKKVEKKEAELDVQLSEYEDLKTDLEAEEDSVQMVLDAKQDQLKKYEAEIAETEDKKDEFAKDIAEQEKILENLLEQERKRQEEEERRRREQGKISVDNTKSGFRWPLDVAGTITSGFGSRKSPTAGASSYHQGIDIGVPSGTPIYAAAAGTVTTAGYNRAEGNYVMIYHGNSTYTIYMHCSRLAVSSGAQVKKGSVVGYVGSTGISTGPHLHFGISVGGSYKNPLNYVSR